MIFLILISVVLIALGILAYRKGTANEDYFKDRNIPYLKPTFLVGNIDDIFLRRKSFLDFAIQMTSYENEARYVKYEYLQYLSNANSHPHL